jgi:SAM-dependent methyltransferase
MIQWLTTDMPKSNFLSLILRVTPFSIRHIGNYVRTLYFFRTVRALPLSSFNSILDAGCGGAYNALKLAKKHPQARVQGMDIEVPCLGSLPPPNFSFECKDILTLNDSGAYDLIYSIDVLEHIPDNREVVRRFHKALKDGGYLYLHMPNRTNACHIFPEKYFRSFDNWAKEEHRGDMYTLPEITLLLEHMGFKIVEARHTFGLLGRIAWELDRITDGQVITKLMMMPILKSLAQLAVRLPAKTGDFLVLARKVSGERN